MKKWALALVCFGFMGCGDSTDETDVDTDTDSCPETEFDCWQGDIVGDLSCYTAGEAWLTDTVNPEAQVLAALQGTALDFESDDPVPDATVQLYYDDDARTGSYDAVATSAQDGTFSMDVPTCQGTTYKVSTDPVLDAIKVTWESHQVFAYPGADAPVVENVNSVSKTTYALIPGILGVSVDKDKSVIAGAAYDCAWTEVQGGQVKVVSAADGSVPDGIAIHYFSEGFPTRDQPVISDDGLWLAANVPAGDWEIQLWGLQGGEEVHLGSTKLTTVADNINIANIYSGYGDGVRLPDSCLVAE
jgi:hypothetical protein